MTSDTKLLTPWQPITDPRKVAVFGKTVEELGELTNITGRILCQGVDGKNPSTGKANRQALAEEIGDVLAQIQRIIIEESLDQDVILSRSVRKFEYLHGWLQTLDADHDGWFSMDKISLPVEVLNGEVPVSIWMQPDSAMDDVSQGRFVEEAYFRPTELSNVPALNSGALGRHWFNAQGCLASSSTRWWRVHFWRYTNNPPKSTPTLTTA